MRPRRDNQPWTDAERESLAVAWADGALRRRDVGNLLGRSEQAVAQEALKRKLGVKAWAPMDQRQAAKSTKLSAAHVAELLRRGISQATINMMGKR